MHVISKGESSNLISVHKTFLELLYKKTKHKEREVLLIIKWLTGSRPCVYCTSVKAGIEALASHHKPEELY